MASSVAKRATREHPLMIRNTAACTVLLATCVSCSSNRHPDISGSAEMLCKAALSKAKQEGKRVFVLFTAPGASWCERFDAYHADPEVRSVLGKHFVLLRIDRQETPGGEHMYEGYGGTGSVPAFSILAADGMLIANSGGGAENIGFPTTADELERYFAALQTACPALTDDEIKFLRAKLEEQRPKEPSPEGGVTPAPSAGAPECRKFPRIADRFV